MTALSKFTLEHGSDSDLLISDLLLGWNEFEKQHGRLEFCDFNISGHQSSKQYSDYSEIKRDLDTALNAQDIQSCPITMKRLFSLKEHFLIRTRPQNVNLNTHYYNALGHTPQIIPEEKIQTLKDEYIKACDDAGIGTKNFEQQLKKHDEKLLPNEIEGRMLDYFGQSKKEIESLIGQNTDFSVNFQTKYAPEETWYLWIDGYKKDFTVSINTHFYKHGMPNTDAFLLANHELTGHGIYYSLIADRVRRKENPIHAGITTVIGPEVFVAEAVAEVMPVYLDMPKSKLDIAHAANQHYIRAILNNIVMTFKSQGTKQAKQYGLESLDEDYHPLVKTRIKDFENMNPVDISYLSVYGTVHCNFREALNTIGKEKFSDIIKQSYLNYLTPEDLNILMKEKGVPKHALFNTNNPELAI